MTLTLTPNRDILAAVSALEKRPFCVGFAAETQELEKYARTKLADKNLDMIAANQVGAVSGGFNADQNQLEVFWPDGQQSLPMASKADIAIQLIDLIASRYTDARS